MATPSPRNRSSYGATIRPGVSFGSIADIPAVPVGRPMDAQRRFEQLSRQRMRTGDVAGSAQALGMSERLGAGGFVPLGGRLPMMMPRDAGMPMGPMPSPQPRPMMPPTLDAATGQPVSARNAPMPAPAPMSMAAPEPAPVNPFEMTPLGGYVDPQFGMVPNGFNAMNQRLATDPAGFPGVPMPPPGLYGAEAAPRVDVARLPGTDYVAPIFDGKVSAQTIPMAKEPEPLSFAPVPGTDLMMPRGQGADRLPMMQNRGTIEGPRPSPETIGPMPGMPNLQPAVKSGTAAKAPTLKQIYEGDVPQNVQWNEQRNRWERVKIYNPGDPDDNGIPGDQSGGAGAAAKAKPAPAPQTSPGGFKFTLAQ